MSETPNTTKDATARVIASFGRHYVIESDGELLTATRRGKRGDVAVGDRVHFGHGAQGQAVIESIAPRSSLLFRTDGIRTKELAANVDLAVVVIAPQPAYNIRFVWRALIAASCAGIESLVVLNKVDLDGAEAAGTRLEELRVLGDRTLRISAKRDPDAATRTLLPLLTGRVSLLIGQSGMGKSTLLNLLVPNADARTQEFSRHLNAGKQTTTSTRWFPLSGGGALIDSPGFQAFGLSHLDRAAIGAALPEFVPFLGHCRFADCRHAVEPDCAIRAAVDAGRIDPQRYAFYLDLVGTPA
jgi:ribosome biogenesis GTPase